MTINEKALRAAADFAEEQGWAVDDNSDGTYRDDVRNLGTFAKIIGAYLDALPASPDGKLRVRVCVGQDEYGNWVATGAKGLPDDIAKSEVTDRVLTDYWRPQFHWIEADIPKWQPPAEETVQGREVEG